MTNYRYRQFLVPLERYLRRMTPRSRRWLALAEGSLLLLLLSSLIFYLQ